ncbi:alpha/beta hydrolase [Motiliproteus sp.]|uniref:alpha/beta hydrolase n=1 Tax=Motiliproteus sp. TaxID=1898955 RepID=UPI003BAC249C
MAWWISLLWFCLLSYLALVGLTYLFQDNLVFQQRALDPADQQRWQAYQVEFERQDGIRLHGWFRQSTSEGAPLLIYYGGNAEEISWNLEPLGRFNASLLLINYRGYGHSSGKPSEAALKEDALWLLDQITTEYQIPLARTFVMGRSLGSGIAAYVAAERAIAASILVTPYDNFIALGRLHYPWLPVDWLAKHRFESDRLAAQIASPALSLLAGKDRIVPPERGRRLMSLWGGETEILEFERADHIDITDQPGYWEAIGRFIEQHSPNRTNRH